MPSAGVGLLPNASHTVSLCHVAMPFSNRLLLSAFYASRWLVLRVLRVQLPVVAIGPRVPQQPLCHCSQWLTDWPVLLAHVVYLADKQ